MKLTAAQRRFVAHWGEMGSRWGVNRTVAQVHALLYVLDRPLTADEITAGLGVARSNVSTSLRELQGWGIVRSERPLGERKDRFSCLRDAWELFRTILRERKHREFDPTLHELQACHEAARAGGEDDTVTSERIGHLRGFMEDLDRTFHELDSWPRTRLVRVLALGQRLGRLFGRWSRS